MPAAIQSMPFMIEANGASLVGQAQGSGNSVVLLHGFADDRRSWERIAGELSREHRVVRYDLRGYGESTEIGRVPFRHARDLLLVLDALEIARTDLVGVSMGGAVAVSFALDFPARVRRLVLISPLLAGWQWSPEWRSLWSNIRNVAATGNVSQARELWWNHPLFATTRLCQPAGEILHRGISRYSGAHWLHDNEERALPDVERLHTLAAPTLLLTGKHDVDDFRLIADLIAAAAPGVTRIDLPDAGHLPQLEYPAEVVEQIGNFLR